MSVLHRLVFEIPADAAESTEDDPEEGVDDHSQPKITVRERSIAGRWVGCTRIDGACVENAKDGGGDELNKEEGRAEWDEEGGKEEEKEEERKEDKPIENLFR